MPPSSQPRVFISYAHQDGAELAQQLHADLAKNFDTWLDTRRLTAGDIWSREIEDAIDRASVVVALLSAGSYVSDICRAEQQRALEKGKCVVPVRVQTDCDIPIYLQTRQWLDFGNPKVYPELLPRLVEGITKQSGVAVSAELLVRYNNAPAVPENFVERPEILERLRNTLFTEGANRNIALTAMQGMGGIGKTILAQALCHDEVVQQAFPDGIFWFAIGKESQLDFGARIKSVPGLDRLLGIYDSEAACLAQYRDVLRKKAALIVVDDVWRVSDVQPFLAESPRSRLLITTRDTSIGAWLGAHEFTANLLTEVKSRQVLANWCRRAVEQLPSQADDLIRECGYLPLALAMIGAQLRGKPLILWNSVLDHLRKGDFKKINAEFPEPHTTLFRAIQISVDALDETTRRRYLALAVLLQDMAATPQVQQCIWGVNETAAAETAEQFIALSLAQYDQPEGSILLHDLQLDYVRAQLPSEDRQALDLIHGALRLSSTVIADDPGQFVSQIVARLVPYLDISAIAAFVQQVAGGAKERWLRSMHPALHFPGTGLIRTLRGHMDTVYAVAQTDDRRIAVSASGDQTLKVWEVDRGRVLRTLMGHTAPVYGVALSGNGRLAVSASGDQTLKVWEVDSGRVLRTLMGHTDEVRKVALTQDGRLAVSASRDQTLKVWEVDSGHVMRTLQGDSPEGGVALTQDGRLAVSASRDRTLKVWEVDSGRVLRTLFGHTRPVMALAVTRDGRLAVSASLDHTLKVWDVDSGHELRSFIGHTEFVNTVAVTLDGQRAVSGSWDGNLTVWDVRSGREVQSFGAHAASAEAVAVTPDGQRVLSASSDQTLKVWDLGSGPELRSVVGHTAQANCVALSGDGRLAVSGSDDRTLKVWEVTSGRVLQTLRGHTDRVTGVAVSGDGRLAVSASWDKTLKVWDLASGRDLRTLHGHAGSVNAVAMIADGQRAISGSSDNTLKAWDLSRFSWRISRVVRTLKGHKISVTAVAVTPDGQLAISAAADLLHMFFHGTAEPGQLKVWHLASGRELRRLSGHTLPVTAVAVTPDGQLAISAAGELLHGTGEPGELKVWEVASGRELYSLTGHTGAVRGVAISRDGRMAVSASEDNTVKMWKLETCECLASFTCDSSAECCAYSDTLKVIVAGDAGGHVHFLRLEEPTPTQGGLKQTGL